MTQSTEQERAHALAEKHGATSYRNRADTSNPAFGFTLGQLEALISEVEQAARRTPAAPVPQGWKPVPVELLERIQESLGSFVSDQGWGQADMDTFDDLSALAAAPQPPENQTTFQTEVGAAPQQPDGLMRENPATKPEAAPVQLPEPQAEIEVRSMKTYLDLSIHEWRDTLPDGAYNIYTEHQVRELLAAHGIQEQST